MRTDSAPQYAGFRIGTSQSSLTSAEAVYTQDILSGPNGSFTVNVTSLSPSTKYYYKAFMSVSDGNGGYKLISSSAIGEFTTPAHSTGTPQWMELPAMSSSDGLTFYAHDLNGNEYVKKSISGHRNWSCYWSPSHAVSYWVAYPMFSDVMAQNVSRTDAFGYDPIVPSSEQPYIGSGSNGGTYANDSQGTAYSRGHQIPSADRLSTSNANKTTFYATNMTPQTQSFNGGIWEALEGKVRTWATASDTLYVVTGCLVEGSTRTTTDKSGNVTVTVPTHYYKALLRVKNGTYSGRAFIFQHFGGSYNSSQLESYAISIDALETQTGLDFFPNLVNKVGSTTAASIENTVASW